MILPTKHISVEHSVLGAGAAVLENLHSPQTVTALWERVRRDSEVTVYWRYVLALDLLYSIGAIDFADGLVVRSER